MEYPHSNTPDDPPEGVGAHHGRCLRRRCDPQQALLEQLSPESGATESVSPSLRLDAPVTTVIAVGETRR